MIIRTTNNPNYLIVETGNSFTVYEKFGESFVVASENSWKELAWAVAEIKSLSKGQVNMDIVVVLQNTDFQTGNGFNVFHKAFLSRSLAHDYIMSQSGILGSEQKFCHAYDGIYHYNGYCYMTVPLNNKVLSQEKIEELKKELDQIKAREKEIRELLK